MRKFKYLLSGLVLTSALMAGNTNMAVSGTKTKNNRVTSGSCSTKLFSVTIDNQLAIGDVIENIAEACNLTVIVKDAGAAKRMNKKLYYVKMKNNTLRGFLNTILKDNDLNYVLKGNKLKISYLSTRTFKVDYISGHRIGKSSANVTIANSKDSTNQVTSGVQSGNNNGGSRTGISIETRDEFKFWGTIQQELKRILISAGDGSTHYTHTGTDWIGPDGQVWDYNPLEPIVNPEAGLITITGTNAQLERVSRYINELSSQIKQQVLIDVRILSVIFDNSSTTGVDWNQIYGLQNITVNSLLMAQKNVSGYNFVKEGITDALFQEGSSPRRGGVVSMTGSVEVTDIVKFLQTQGTVKAISSPRVMTLNNQPALISVGRELFYKIKSATTASSGGGAVAAEGELIDSVFAGVLLDITPQIDKRGMITLKVNPSITDTIEDQSTVSGERTIPPDLRRRQIAAVVRVKDGEHAIIGGLISTRTGTKEDKVPFLGDIPIIKQAFNRTEKIETVEELVIIITPHIIKNSKSVTLRDLGYRKAL